MQITLFTDVSIQLIKSKKNLINLPQMQSSYTLSLKIISQFLKSVMGSCFFIKYQLTNYTYFVN